MTSPTIDRRHPDRRITAVLVLSGIVVVLVALGTPAVISTSNTTREVRDGSDISGCRSSYSAAVTDKRTDFDIARSHRDSRASEVNIMLLELAQSAIFGDEARVHELQPQLPAARQAVTDANRVVDDANAALVEANATYQDAITLSREDPQRFLATCEEKSL